MKFSGELNRLVYNDLWWYFYRVFQLLDSKMVKSEISVNVAALQLIATKFRGLQRTEHSKPHARWLMVPSVYHSNSRNFGNVYQRNISLDIKWAATNFAAIFLK